MDRERLAEFLRTRREALQPEDVGLPRGRRRAVGLRREEVAVLSDMSVDYLVRIEQGRGPHPSEQLLGALARGLRLSPEERDHLFRLAGYPAPGAVPRGDHINPGMLRILDGLADGIAQVVNRLGTTLRQTQPAVALLGDQTHHIGPARSLHYRWFTDRRERALYPAADHPARSRRIVSDLQQVLVRDGEGSEAAELVDALLAVSEEFATIWREHPVAGRRCGSERFVHPQVGELELHCQILTDPDGSQVLLVYTANPGTDSHDRLRLLSVPGDREVELPVSVGSP
ncbi:helix-turn-helix transcriptional regulator [Pseudonocardia sp. GCM10023141]|uniref:helix-turn-helix transcriptional regulator n=1 Tax=Pseudonocardia sp. GCM10023141 TaxID=3252653 RepID=UPI00361D8E8C